MNRRRAFTLIELMIAITIVAVLTMASYAPYNYYQNKAKLKVTSREISQVIYESRNMAINGAVGSSSNVSIGVYFDTSTLGNNTIQVFSYPYNILDNNINHLETVDTKLLKTLTLKKGIQIDSIDSNNNFLFYFEAITGDIKYFRGGGSPMIPINITLPDSESIDIDFSYKGSSSPNLNKSISYFTLTNIIDY